MSTPSASPVSRRRCSTSGLWGTFEDQDIELVFKRRMPARFRGERLDRVQSQKRRGKNGKDRGLSRPPCSFREEDDYGRDDGKAPGQPPDALSLSKASPLERR